MSTSNGVGRLAFAWITSAALSLAACGGSSSSTTGATSSGGSTTSGSGGTGASTSTGATSSGGSTGGTMAGGTGGSTTGGSTTGGSTTGGTGGTGGATTGGSSTGGSMMVTPEALLALTQACNVASKGKYATDDGDAEKISICKLNGAFFWNADMDVDCDGKTSPQCNKNTDPAYQNQTSANDSKGDPLDAATLPFVVVPLPSSRFDYMAEDIHLGGVVAVIYQGKLEFGVFGDEGPDNIIGEASYAMANLLGIDPDPSNGGVDSGVTYIVFTGAESVVSKNEDHAEAVTLGMERAAAVLGSN